MVAPKKSRGRRVHVSPTPNLTELLAIPTGDLLKKPITQILRHDGRGGDGNVDRLTEIMRLEERELAPQGAEHPGAVGDDPPQLAGAARAVRAGEHHAQLTSSNDVSGGPALELVEKPEIGETIHLEVIENLDLDGVGQTADMARKLRAKPSRLLAGAKLLRIADAPPGERRRPLGTQHDARHH